VLAVAVADVLVRDLNPGVSLGLGDHPLHQAAILLLDVGAAGDLRLGLANADNQGVADALELGGAEDPWASHRTDRPVNALAWEGRGPKLGKLLLQPRDLAAKLVAKGAIVGRDEQIQRHVPPAASDRRQVVLERFSHA